MLLVNQQRRHHDHRGQARRHTVRQIEPRKRSRRQEKRRQLVHHAHGGLRRRKQEEQNDAGDKRHASAHSTQEKSNDGEGQELDSHQVEDLGPAQYRFLNLLQGRRAVPYLPLQEFLTLVQEVVTRVSAALPHLRV